MFFPFFSILLRSPPSKRNWSGVEREGSTAERARERGEGGKGKERARGVFSSSHFSGNLTSSPFPLFSSSSSSLVSPHLWPGRSLIVSEQLSATISVISQGGARGGFSGRVFLYVVFFFLSFQPAIPRSLIFFFSLSDLCGFSPPRRHRSLFPPPSSFVIVNAVRLKSRERGTDGESEGTRVGVVDGGWIARDR